MNAPPSPKQIEYWPLTRLKPYARNAKTHDVDQVARIVKDSGPARIQRTDRQRVATLPPVRPPGDATSG